MSSSSGVTKSRGGRKAANPHLTEEQRRRERILKNRESAMKSLQKKKRYTQHLELRAVQLANRNAHLKHQIRAQLLRLQQMGLFGPLPTPNPIPTLTCMVNDLNLNLAHLAVTQPPISNSPITNSTPPLPTPLSTTSTTQGTPSTSSTQPVCDFTLVNSLLPSSPDPYESPSIDLPCP